MGRAIPAAPSLVAIVLRPGTCFAQSGMLIDHVVSRSDEWHAGAREWDDQRRRDFANEPRNPRLLVTAQPD